MKCDVRGQNTWTNNDPLIIRPFYYFFPLICLTKQFNNVYRFPPLYSRCGNRRTRNERTTWRSCSLPSGRPRGSDASSWAPGRRYPIPSSFGVGRSDAIRLFQSRCRSLGPASMAPRPPEEGLVVSRASAASGPALNEEKPWYRLGKPQPPDSGWERVRELFCRE